MAIDFNDVMMEASEGPSVILVQGIAGHTPSISVGNVESVAADAGAEVNMRGTVENPIIDFKIPRGVNGYESINDNAGDGDTDFVWSANKTYNENKKTKLDITDPLKNAEIELGEWKSGYYDLSGDTVDINSRTSSSSYVSCVFQCTGGDVFILTSTGGNTARNWGVLSSASGSSNVISKKYSPYESDKEIITTHSSSNYIVFNADVSNPYIVIKFNVYKYVLSMKFNFAETIPSGSDLNTYKTEGNFRVTTYAASQTITNIPEVNPGRLLVMSLVSSSNQLQIYVTNTNHIYSRVAVSDNWTSWQSLINQDLSDLFTLTYNKSTIIPNSSDLDTYLTIGNYYISSAASAKTISNMPVALGGRLTVLKLSGTGSVHHWYIDSNGDWHTRECIGNVFTDWKHLATTDVIQDSIIGTLAGKSAYNITHALAKQADYDIAFANAFVPLSLQNYVGNNQNVHPKVLYFSSGFGGHKYWMAYTPYPYSNDVYENPCVAYSDDGIVWRNINANPIDNPQGVGYDSDTHLVYNSGTNKLECWYRWVAPSGASPRSEIIYRQISSDGVTWGDKEVIFDNNSGDYANLLSPAIFIENNKYCMWVVQGSHSPVTIDYYESPVSDVINWTKVRSLSLSFTDDGTSVSPWHLDAIKDGDTYVLLVQCRNSQDIATAKCSLFITTSTDNETYTTPEKVVGGADSWDKYMYRSSIVKIGNSYRIYYSAGSGGTTTIYNKAVWGIGITEGSSLSNFYGLYE